MSLYGCRAEESALAILFPLMAGHNGYSQTVGQVGDPEQEPADLRQGPASQ